jgi:glycosyltransferase involved in cell wall biosynthesis
MRIAMVSTPFVALPPRGYGGTELVVDVLVRALARLGHTLTVFATGDSRVPGVLRARFPAAVWPPDPRIELLHARFAAAEIAAGAFDVVHSHVAPLLQYAHRLGAPVVHTMHHERDEALERLYAKVPRVVRVAISARQGELQRSRPHAVVHHGLDPALYPVAGRGGDRAFFLGRLSWVKGPEIAIEAARLAGLEIDVAGSRHPDEAPAGWEQKVLEPALRASHVRCLSDVDVAAKRRAFARSRALLVPIRWEEPFGLVMIEAALAGCPVIAFARGAAPEIVEDGVTGFLVGSVREMAAALRAAGRLDRRLIQARSRERFSARRMADDYLSVYRAAIRAAEPDASREAGAEEGTDGWTTLVR